MRLHQRHAVRRRISQAIGHRLAVIGTVAAVTGGLSAGGAVTATPASAATTVSGCTIVAQPTPTNHTNCPGAQLTGANLRGVDLSFANLSKASMAWDNLSGANLTGANLSGAKLAAVDLSGANLSGANLAGTTLTFTRLGHADLSTAHLTGATLAFVDLTKTRLGGADLRGARLFAVDLSAALFCATAMPDGSINSAGCSISVSPPAATIAKGLTQAFTATGTYRDGTPAALGANVSWGSSDLTRATVTPAGVATAVNVGSAVISATAGAAVGRATLTVGPPALTSITVAPATAAIVGGTTQAFGATGHYTDTSSQDLTSIATWSSSKAQVATVAPTGVATGVGPGSATIQATSGAVSGTATLGVVGALGITTTSLPGAVQGSPYSQTLAAVGGKPAYSWSVSSGSLPAGLSLSPAGVITGAPTAAGPTSFSVQVADPGPPAQTATQALSITVASSLAITTTSLPDAVRGVPGYSQALAASGGTGADTWALAPGSTPPAGLSLNANGTVSGTPTQTGTYTVTVQATDQGVPPQVVTKTLSIKVVDPLAVATTALPSSLAGTQYSQQLAATGGTTPYQWSLAPGSSLPAGLNLGGDGTLAGTLPATPGTLTFTVQVTDGGSPAQVATKTLTIGVASPLVVVNTSLPAVVAGSAYSQTLPAPGGGTPPFTWSVTAGTLPNGLSLNPTSGVISGAPTATGTFNFTVTVTDSTSPAQTGTEDLSITVAPVLSVNSTIPASGVANVAYSQPLAPPSGGTPPFSWSVSQGSLPPGLTLDSSTGLISGTPTTAGTYNFTVQITDAGIHTGDPQSGTEGLSISVGPALSIATTTLAGGVTNTAYSQTLAATGGSPPYHQWSFFGGSLPPGLTLDNSTGIISGTPTQAGTYSFTASVGDNAGGVATQPLTIVVVDPLAITTTSLPDAVAGSSYNATLTASGGVPSAPPNQPYEWFLVNNTTLPPGLSLDFSSGVISGTPTTSGTFNFTVQALDAGSQTTNKDLSINVADPLTITTTSLPAWDNVDQKNSGAPFCRLPNTICGAYDSTLQAIGGTPGPFGYTWSIVAGHLPPGLSLGESFGQQTDGGNSASPGEINSSGVALGTIAPGTYIFTVQASDGKQTATKTLSFNVVGPPPPGGFSISEVVDCNNCTDLLLGHSVSVQLVSASGGTPPYTFSVAGGALPPGLTIDNSGQVSGTLSLLALPGSYNVAFQVTDSENPAQSYVTTWYTFTVGTGGGGTCVIGCNV